MPADTLLAGFCLLLFLMALADLAWGLIPDRFVYPGIVMAFIASPWWIPMGRESIALGATSPLFGVLGAAAGAGMVAAPLALLAWRWPGRMCWGDVSMGVFVGAVCGLPTAWIAAGVAAISGGLMASLAIAAAGTHPRGPMAFGPYLALGGLVAVAWGDPIWAWYWAKLA